MGGLQHDQKKPVLSVNPFEKLCLPDRTDQISADFIKKES
jgi:hypothetical protein